MKFVNLTPHALNVNPNVESINIPPSGTIARVSVERQKVAHINGIAISRVKYGEPVNLPDEEDGVLLIVSAMVASHPLLKGRNDILYPGEAIRDSEGRVIGCDGLSMV